MSAIVQRKLQQAYQFMQNGDAESAAALCEEVLRNAPRNPDALWLLGTAHLTNNRAQDAASLFERTIQIAPRHGAALEHLGLARLMLGDYGAAEAALRKAAAIPGSPPSVLMRLGLALYHQGRTAEAVEALQRAIRLDPADLDAHLSLGRAYGAQENWAEAAREFRQVLQKIPHHVDALYNMGVVAFELRDVTGARSWLERCLSEAPGHMDARERLAQACLALGRFPEARAHLEKVVEAQPANSAALAALAQALLQCGALEEAIAFARKASALDGSQSAPYGLLAQIHHVRGELDRAVEVLEEGIARTDADPLLGTLVHILHRQCDWDKWAHAWPRMAQRLEQATDLGSPFWLLCETTSPQQQLSYTKRWTAKNYPALSPPSPVRAARSGSSRVRIGYFSGDFHQHPVPCLIAEVLELHDRSRYEVFAYSYGPDDRSAMRVRLQNAVEHFIDVAWEPDDAVAERIRSADLDLLIDLKGFTAGDRLRVMASRPCPVQIAWLGYPGTTGASFIDYLIADRFVVPADAEHGYSERIVRLPNCYQPNDRKRHATASRTRTEYGLPEEGFVFCCFNQANKVTPGVLAVWLRLLRALPRSVLWLLEDNPWASRNLVASAVAVGLHPSRLVIAPRLSPPDHLARYRVADLALDTFPYTSHTTGSDALWMGCPLVALCGETFASRVSASLLFNCDLPQLVTPSLKEYEELAYRLATDPELMQDLRTRVAAARARAPLFDSARFVRDLEALYLQLIE